VQSVSRYLRQIARLATGESLPGQVRPLFRPMAAVPARGDPEQLFDETTLEQESAAEEMSARPHRLPVNPAPTGASLNPPAPSVLAVPPRPPATVGETLPTKTERADRPRAGNELSVAPTSSQRLDSIETLLPSRGVDESGHNTPSSARRPFSLETGTKEGEDTVETELPPLRNGRSTASPLSGERQRDPERRQPEAGQPGRSASASAPEIHIHIGRVELTALQATPAKSTARSVGKKPMSLDDYLRQRDGRRT